MTMVTIMLAFIIVAVGFIYHDQFERNVQRSMKTALSENSFVMELGRLPKGMESPDTHPAEQGGNNGSDSTESTPPIPGIKEMGTDTPGASPAVQPSGPEDIPEQEGGLLERAQGSMFLPVAVYRVLDDGTLELVAENSVSISGNVAKRAMTELSDADAGFGKLHDLGLYYMKGHVHGETRIAFADKTDVDSNFRNLMVLLIAAALGAWLVFFLASFFLARWATKPVVRAWHQQSRFIADASHELKTPLAVILANNSILLSHPDKTISEHRQWVESTQAEAEMMETLISDLLFLAKPDSDQDSKLYGDIDLSEIVATNALQFESVAFERHIDLDSNIAEGIIVHANGSRLQRLVGTLIDNACKYANEGGHVDISLYRRGHEAVLHVSNTGNPIASEDLPNIFDRFYRADKARSRDSKGYGLGLSIAKEVAEELGGTISVTERAGFATTFTVRIPSA